MTWRVGRHYPIHVYDGDTPVATFLTAADAARAVAAVNAAQGAGGKPQLPNPNPTPTPEVQSDPTLIVSLEGDDRALERARNFSEAANRAWNLVNCELDVSIIKAMIGYSVQVTMDMRDPTAPNRTCNQCWSWRTLTLRGAERSSEKKKQNLREANSGSRRVCR